MIISSELNNFHIQFMITIYIHSTTGYTVVVILTFYMFVSFRKRYIINIDSVTYGTTLSPLYIKLFYLLLLAEKDFYVKKGTLWINDFYINRQ